MSLSETQIAEFHEQGCVLVPGFFTTDELNALKKDLERMIALDLGHNVVPEAVGQTENVNYQIIPINDKSDLVRALPFCEKVIEAVTALIDSPVVRQLDQIFVKPGGSGKGTSWHQDNAYFHISDPSKGTAMWIALDDATIDNGTMWLVPGSFKNELLEHGRDPASDHHIAAKGVDESRAIPVELRAGGCAFFNYGTLHCTRDNTSDQQRSGLALHFLRQDFINGDASSDTYVKLTGDDATGGRTEYGQEITGTWLAEVEKMLAHNGVWV